MSNTRIQSRNPSLGSHKAKKTVDYSIHEPPQRKFRQSRKESYSAYDCSDNSDYGKNGEENWGAREKIEEDNYFAHTQKSRN